eukprot:4631173-Amphidinium_carterae.1
MFGGDVQFSACARVEAVLLHMTREIAHQLKAVLKLREQHTFQFEVEHCQRAISELSEKIAEVEVPTANIPARPWSSQHSVLSVSCQSKVQSNPESVSRAQK